MRIRKNAKLVVEGSKRRGSTSFLICQLNRSPWDVADSFFSQDELGNDLPLNGSLNEFNLASDSARSGESMELSFECVAKTTPTQSEQENKSNIGGEAEEIGDLLQCCSNVGQPKRSRTLVHRFQRSFSAPLAPTPLPNLPKKRGRPKKSSSAAAASAAAVGDNPYEFYYYSGFGPSWRKTRRNGNNSAHDNGVVYIDNDDVDDNGNYYDNSMNWNPGSYSDSHESMSKEVNDDNDNDDEEKTNKNEIERVVGEELDYIYDDEEEELYGKGGARKPIKARSLKSLM